MSEICECGHNKISHQSPGGGWWDGKACFWDYNCDCVGFSPREEKMAEDRLAKLERTVAQQQNLITKLQQELIKASKYENADLSTRVDGIQIFLKRAGEAQGRERGRKRG